MTLQNRFYLLSGLFWLALLAYINTVPPDNILAKIIFFVILFLCFFSTSFLLIKRLKRNLLFSLYPLFITIMYFINQFNLLNLVLITALFVALFFLLDTR
jgi:hypothetical protein